MISIKISKSDCPLFNNIELTEPHNDKLVNKLLNSDIIKKDDGDDNKLRKLQAKKTNRTKYKFKSLPYGRVYPTTENLCTLPKYIRHTIEDGYYYDIDIKNCHPSILLNVCLSNKIKCTQLNFYVNNRTKVLDRLAKVYDTTKDCIKDLLISLLYNGSIKSWMRRNDIKVNSLETDFLLPFRDEVKDIMKAFIDNNKKLYNLVAKKKFQSDERIYNIEGSFFSLCIQEYERVILETCFSYLRENGVVTSTAVLCYDGIMIPKSNVTDVKKLCSNINGYVKSKTGFDVEFVEKPMNFSVAEKISSFSDKPPIFEKYYKLKEKFEKTICKLMNPMRYVRITDYGIQLVSGSELVEQYRSYSDFRGAVHCSSDSANFITNWLNDPSQRVCERLVFKPNTIDCKADEFNTYDGMPYESDSHKYDLKLLEPLFKHIRLLVGDHETDKCLDYMLNWISHIIQKPHKKTLVTPIIRSAEGTGKGMFFSFLKKVIGKKYCYETCNPLRDIFGRFNKNIEEKLLICVNESQQKDTIEFFEQLKSFITDEVVTIERKGLSQYDIENLCNFMFFTNNFLAVPLSENGRRFIAFQSNNSMAQNVEYFNPLQKYLNDADVQQHFYNFCMSRDISKFEPSRDRIITPFHKVCVGLTGDDTVSLFMEDLKITHDDDEKSEFLSFPKLEFYKMYCDFCKDNNVGERLIRKSFSASIAELSYVTEYRPPKQSRSYKIKFEDIVLKD